MALDFCLRLSSPLLVSNGYLGVNVTSSFVSCMEVCRRGMWNLFRLENRHLAHCREQRARQTKPLEHVEWRLRDTKAKLDARSRRGASASDLEAIQQKQSRGALDVTASGPRDCDVEMAEVPRSLASTRSDEPLFLSDSWLRLKLRQTQMSEKARRPASPPAPLFPESLDEEAGHNAETKETEAVVLPIFDTSGASLEKPAGLVRSVTALLGIPLRLASKSPRSSDVVAPPSPKKAGEEEFHNEHDEDAPLEEKVIPFFDGAFHDRELDKELDREGGAGAQADGDHFVKL
jgi:hypothetical protein